MKITVAEARLLKNAIEQKIGDLERERQQIAYVEFEKGEEYSRPNRTFDEVTAELNEAREHYRQTQKAIAESNISTKIEFKGGILSIVEALELVKQLRSEVNALKRFGQSKTVEIAKSGAFDSRMLYKKALFDPSSVKAKSDQLLKDANTLSILIDKANFMSFVELDFVDQYQ